MPDNNQPLLDDFDLDLEDIMSQEEIDRAIRASRRPPKSASRKPKADEVQHVPQPSPWRCTSAVLAMQRTICRCGCTFEAPVARMPLAHFDNIHDKSKTWEVTAHPSTLNSALPRHIRWLETYVEACPSCFLHQGDVTEEHF